MPEKLEKTSQALGELLARNGFGLITGGWPGVDDTISRAFAREIEKEDLPLEDFLIQVIEENRLPAFPAGDLVLTSGASTWKESIERADAVILIGGLGGSMTAGHLGLMFGKAVFPLADTGGDAKEFYLHMLKEWSPSFFKSIDKKTFQIVAREAPGVVKHLLPLLITL